MLLVLLAGLRPAHAQIQQGQWELSATVDLINIFPAFCSEPTAHAILGYMVTSEWQLGTTYGRYSCGTSIFGVSLDETHPAAAVFVRYYPATVPFSNEGFFKKPVAPDVLARLYFDFQVGAVRDQDADRGFKGIVTVGIGGRRFFARHFSFFLEFVGNKTWTENAFVLPLGLYGGLSAHF